MQKEGFEYIPWTGYVSISIPGEDWEDPDDLDWSSLEFIEQYGFGAFTSPGEKIDAYEGGRGA